MPLTSGPPPAKPAAAMVNRTTSWVQFWARPVAMLQPPHSPEEITRTALRLVRWASAAQAGPVTMPASFEAATSTPSADSGTPRAVRRAGKSTVATLPSVPSILVSPLSRAS